MFKSLFVAITVVAATTSTSQAIEFVNQDGSKLSELCITVAESNTAKVSKIETSNILCNGMTLKNFAKQYRANTTQDIVKVVAFENGNNTPESELCIAAATSNEAFAQVKTGFNQSVINDVACNGVELVKFAKRYNKSFNG